MTRLEDGSYRVVLEDRTSGIATWVTDDWVVKADKLPWTAEHRMTEALYREAKPPPVVLDPDGALHSAVGDKMTDGKNHEAGAVDLAIHSRDWTGLRGKDVV